MVDGINELSDSNPDNKIQISRQTNAAKGPLLNPKESSIGLHAVHIKDSELLGPQAYNADDAGITAFRSQNYAHTWGAEQSIETLEGHASKKSPNNLYVLFLVKNGDYWIKYIQAESIAMNIEIDKTRAALKTEMYHRGIKMEFDELVKSLRRNRDLSKERIQDENVQNGKISVLTSASDDFTSIASGEKFTEEASPMDINPKEKKRKKSAE